VTQAVRISDMAKTSLINDQIDIFLALGGGWD